MRMRIISLLVGVALLSSSVALQAQALNVVASISPIHSLVAAVMQGVGTPALVLRGYGSPHGYQLRPSEAAMLHDADIVFWIGESLETSLLKAINTLVRNARIIELIETPGLTLHPNRRPGAWRVAEQHLNAGDRKPSEQNEHEHHHHEVDAHIWLDPENAKRLIREIARQLSTVDPENEAIYQSNSAQVQSRIDAFDQRSKQQLAVVRTMPYVVFHDAYQYFENHYGLNAIGSLTISPDQMLSARRVHELRQTIKQLRVRCVFSEPQFESALIKTITDGTSAHRGVLDPLGAALEPGPDTYLRMMEANVSAIVDCLSD